MQFIADNNNNNHSKLESLPVKASIGKASLSHRLFADVSVIPQTLFNENKYDDGMLLFAAIGSTIKTFGRKLFKINFGLRRDFSFIFIIAAADRPIIAEDFLTHFHLLVDLKTKN